jgi:hypothetical protein
MTAPVPTNGFQKDIDDDGAAPLHYEESDYAAVQATACTNRCDMTA